MELICPFTDLACRKCANEIMRATNKEAFRAGQSERAGAVAELAVKQAVAVATNDSGFDQLVLAGGDTCEARCDRITAVAVELVKR